MNKVKQHELRLLVNEKKGEVETKDDETISQHCFCTAGMCPLFPHWGSVKYSLYLLLNTEHGAEVVLSSLYYRNNLSCFVGRTLPYRENIDFWVPITPVIYKMW